MKEKFQIMSEEFRQLYTEYDCDYMWDKLVDYQHKTALQMNNPRKAHRFSRGMDSGFIF